MAVVPFTLAVTAVGLASTVTTALTGGGYRPPQWSAGSSNLPQLVYIRPNIGGFFFDAVIHLQHSTKVQITKHPVQSGASIADHAFTIPPKIIFEIGMSDAMSSFVIGQYGSGSSKSVTAYQTLVKMQNARNPLTVVTRLQTYQNMLIEDIDVRDDNKTFHGLRAYITLEQILMASISNTTVPASPLNNTVQAPTTSTNQATNDPNQVPPAVHTEIEPPGVPEGEGAGAADKFSTGQ